MIGKSKKTSGEYIFHLLGIVCVSFCLLTLIVLMLDIFFDGYKRLNPEFFSSYSSRRASSAGIKAPLVGSIYLMVLTAVISFPVATGAAIYLEEYATKNKFTKFIELNIANLAAVPSIIYGLLGLQVFVRFFDFDRSLLSGAMTLSLLILPVIIISSRESLRRVPNNIREAAFALGATRWEVIKDHVLPLAFPGILTGCILAFSRAVGEAAPLIVVGALAYMAYLPDSIFSAYTALPIQAFNWTSRPQADFHQNAAAAIIVLLVLLLMMNAFAVFLRARFEKKYDFSRA